MSVSTIHLVVERVELEVQAAQRAAVAARAEVVLAVLLPRTLPRVVVAQAAVQEVLDSPEEQALSVLQALLDLML